MNLNQELNVQQQIQLNQSLFISLNLLQMNIQDLYEFLNNELQSNPLLEIEYDKSQNEDIISIETYKDDFDLCLYKNSRLYDETEDKKIAPYDLIAKENSLKDFLYNQFIESDFSDEENEIIKYLIECIDDNGYLKYDNEKKISREKFESALGVIQSMDPAGIGARNIEECLKLQLKRKNMLNDDLCKIIDDYLIEAAQNNYSKIAKEIKVSVRQVKGYIKMIKNLEPKPGRGYSSGENCIYIIPDAEIYREGNEFKVRIYNKYSSKLRVHDEYKTIVKSCHDEKMEKYINDNSTRAHYIINGIKNRENTLQLILEYLAKKQHQYFEKGNGYIKPISIKKTSEDLNYSESTVSRTIKDKYIVTPFGTIKLRSLFSLSINKQSENISKERIKYMIKKIIKGENKYKPLSDEDISDILKESGIAISRRTIAKYRQELNIKSSSKRKST